MVDTSLPANIKPPFKDAPITGQGDFSPLWQAFLTTLSDRLNADTGVGVTDGSDAAAGHVGEYLVASATGIGLANNVPSNVVSLDLTAGDWDVVGNVQFTAGAGSHNIFAVGLDGLDTMMTATMQTTAINQAMNTASRRYSLTATQTVQLVADASFSGSMTAAGSLRARRMR